MCSSCGCPHCSCCCSCKCRFCRSTQRESFEPRAKLPYSEHFVCWSCKRGWKTKHQSEEEEEKDFKGSRCPKCAADGSPVGFDFRLPKRSDNKAWSLAHKIYNLPLKSIVNPVKKTFCPSCGERRPYPKSIEEAMLMNGSI